MGRKLSYGIVGFGKVAESQHKGSYPEEMELAAVCDGTEERRAAAEIDGAKAYEDYAEMLNHPEMELVIICTPPNTHCELALKAIEAGKHVLVEKPFALNLEEARRMTNAAGDKGVLVTANQNRRLDGDYLTVRKILETGLLGNVYSIDLRLMGFMEGWSTWGIKSYQPDWRSRKEYGGGLVYDWGSHLGDQLLRLVPSEVESVYTTLQSRVWTKEVDDHFRSQILFRNGTMASIEVSANARLDLPRWYLCGDKGTLKSENGGFKLKTGEAEYEFETQDSQWPKLRQNVYEAVAVGAALIIQPEEILTTVRLLDSMFASAKIGETIRWE